MIKKIDHIGIAVKSIDEQLAWYKDILGLEFLGIENIKSQKVRVAMFAVGDIRLELLEPTSQDSPIHRFLDKKGQGLHHLAYAVDDISQAIEQLKTHSTKMIDNSPRPGAHDTQIAFIHPKSAHGVLNELCVPGKPQ